MTTNSLSLRSTRPALERILPQGTLEKAFIEGETCTQRVAFSKADAGRPPLDGGRALKRGLLAGALAEQQLYEWASGLGFRIDLAQAADEVIARMRPAPQEAADLGEVRQDAIRMVRDWMGRVPPPDDADLDLTEAEPALKPQHDLFVRRPNAFVIRVRPDVVVAVGTTLVALEFSTSGNSAAVSPARAALNHFALLRERLLRPDWGRFTSSVTRVELLSLGYGYTVRLTSDELETWRARIAQVATAMVGSDFTKNIGSHCGACFYQPQCFFGDGEDDDAAF